ncbi:katanin p80 WD40 repeat-containing subunit B1 homolog KTN80.2-like isoform X3 [Rhododendron vialii]|uniref:katanin p80 WD40 repeat-containing subunit B1 homolog KTN80.2-like isoform X3 n=2 Tax=Rhododendron vialii TaxID=182163 RepID=UPI00265FC331|nr:katanin p80 WD40 repeat-containing subunit B1 homolog KTN80.2-like isoform X3 [Rhododendron vialii]
MAIRGYKLQEFVAHSGSVNCLSIGKKTCRLFATGGDDQKVNLWSIGKSTSLMGLSGHASPVESVTFNSAEVLVLAGASAGVVKLWDLEETKMVRTLTGHRSNCTAVEFHPFGEFFASGAMDTNLKVWDTRKKGCIHTYKGHTQGISAVKFTPDGRWVVSGGLDNVVKVWDLTAGKLLHDFKFHEGHIRSLDFHPLEFLLATGSADRTVKFWDLETFEPIGSVRPEATGVRSITFHPDGRTLFCGLDDSLKVYSWEPIVCHDAVDMGWSALGDLCIHDGNLMGCSYYRNSVAVWAADISLIKPYGVVLLPEQDSQFEQKHDLQESPLRKVGIHRRTASSLRCSSPEYETKEIKTIYVDTAGANPVASKRAGSYTSPKVVPPSDSKEMNSLPNQKQSPAVGVHAKSVGQTNAKSFIVPSVVPRDCPDGKDSTNARRESNTSARAGIGMPLRPPHVRRPPATKFDADMLSVPSESEPYRKTSGDTAVDPTFHDRLVADDNAKDMSAEKHLDIKSVAQKFDKVLSPKTPSSKKNCPESLNGTEGTKAVKYVNGVAVVRGRTRSLVERFEMKERSSIDEFQAPDTSPESLSEVAKTSPMLNGHPPITGRELPSFNAGNLTVDVIGIGIRSGANNSHPQITGQKVPSANDVNHTEDLMQNHDVLLSTLRSRLTKLQVVRHFWERNDIKGAIDAVKKFPDHSVQADLISILMEKMEILSLDLFSCLLPVLLCLLDSKIERHANISLEMLLKLVAVFGPVVRSTISAPPAVGVDLHAEQRLKCCNQCSIQLQKIQNILPALVRRGGLLAKCAQELNLVLQAS